MHSASPNARKSNTDSILRVGILLNVVVKEYVHYSYAIAVLFYATVIEDLGVLSVHWSVCLSAKTLKLHITFEWVAVTPNLTFDHEV